VSERNNELPVGTQVHTTCANNELRLLWTKDGWALRKWGVQGSITYVHKLSRSLYYEVRHGDGTEACYDPSELVTASEHASRARTESALAESVAA